MRPRGRGAREVAAGSAAASVSVTGTSSVLGPPFSAGLLDAANATFSRFFPRRRILYTSSELSVNPSSRTRAAGIRPSPAARSRQLTTSSKWFEPQPQELVMTLLGAYVSPSRDSVWSGGLVNLLGEFGFSPGAARVALGRVVRRSLLVRVRDGRHVHYTLTPRSSELLAEGDRRIFSLGRHRHRANAWTVLWHGIPENQRLEHARLTRRLRFLGFGSVQDGTWVSPHDREAEVAALVASLGVSESVAVLLGRPASSIDFLPFARRAWDLDHLDARYEAFAREFSAYVPARVRRQLSEREAFLLRTRLVHMFRTFPFLDPELPDEYMPEPRNRAHAVKVFDSLYPALAPPAQAYFDAQTVARSRWPPG
jgi:phenylacetic acid degradation operon negative regulatory protein